MQRHQLHFLFAMLLGLGALPGCKFPFGNSGGSGGSPSPAPDDAPPARVQMVRFIDPVRPIGVNPPILLGAARNETVHFAVQINNPPKNASRKGYSLQLGPIQQAGGSGAIPLTHASAAQVVPLPIDANRAGFVRYSGLNAEESLLPRAMVPLELNNGMMELAQLRKVAGPPIIWFEIQIPPTIAPGNYETHCDLIEDGRSSFSAPVKIHVEDFVLPDERHLALVGAVEWESLQRHWPGLFANIPPRLLSRKDATQAPAIKLIDEMVRVAHAHRLDLVVPRMQPTVKWLGGKPIIDWTDFDSLAAGWLKGTGFADAVPSGYWPLPVMDKLDEYTPDQQRLYWAEVASHFDQLDWLVRAGVQLPRRGFGRVGLDESYAISTQAAQILNAHPRIRVSVPLEEEQVRLAGNDAAGRILPDHLERLLVSADPLVSTPSLQKLASVGKWLRTDQPGLVPSVGAGADERQTRHWAMLAFLRNARLVQWNSVLPGLTGPDIPADPDEVVWFYPGEWFGVAQPVPSIQLKWLRRAQQDYEYLWLARQRGQGERAATIARLLVKPVELQAGQAPDAIYGLMSASADPKAWDQAVDLLSRTIQLSKPGQSTDAVAERQLTYDLAGWTQAQARPILVPRSAEWTLSPAGMKNSVALKLGIDIYNPADLHPEPNRLQWNGVPESWAVSPTPVDVPRAATFSVGRFDIEAAVDLVNLSPGKAQPARLLFTEGYSKQSYHMSVVLPVSYSEKLGQGRKIVLDGNLKDWMGEDALFQGRMVKLIDRPALQAQRLDLASTESAIYSTWTPQSLYFAFRLGGADAPITNAERSFVERQFGRAWGEDIVEIVLQPIYAAGPGPLFHLTFKPRGQIEVFRRLDPKLNVNPWQAFGSTDIRYATNVTDAIWRGEAMLPWDSLLPPGKAAERPLMLRMNFLQHRGRTGESASWAGPVDLVREDPLMGLLQIRQTDARGFVPNR
ncbi:MAG: hypothetical protein ACHRHE_03115 [Tepidisphaerales bacterium]